MFWSMHSGIIAAIAMVFGRYAATIVPLGDLGHPAGRGRRYPRAVGDQLFRRAPWQRRPDRAHHHQDRCDRHPPRAAVRRRHTADAGGARRRRAACLPARAGRRAVRLRRLAHGDLRRGRDARSGTDDSACADARHRGCRRRLPGLNSAYLLVLPFDRVLASTHIAYDATLATAGAGTASAISILVIVSSFGAMSGIILAGPRVYYAMAQDGLLFKWMGAVHPQHRTPYRRDRDAGDLVVGPGADRHLRRDRLAGHLHRVDLLRRAGAGHDNAAASPPERAVVPRLGLPGRSDSLRPRLRRHRPQSDRDRSARERDRPRARCRRPAGLLRLETHRCP